jgi:hypothetical protein
VVLRGFTRAAFTTTVQLAVRRAYANKLQVHVDYVTIILTGVRRWLLTDSAEEEIAFDISVRTTADSAARVERTVEVLQTDDGSDEVVAAIEEECMLQQITVPSALAASTGATLVENDVAAPTFVAAPILATDEDTGSSPVSDADEASGSSVGAIVGGVVGALVVVAALAVVAIQRKSAGDTSEPQQRQSSAAGAAAVAVDGDHKHNVNPMFSREESDTAESTLTAQPSVDELDE